MGEIIPPAISTLSFVIKGQLAIKKNSQKVVTRGGKTFKIDTPAYTKWRNSAYYQIAQQLGRPDPIFEPVNVRLHIYTDNKRKFDLSNALEGPADVMVSAGILSDDNYTIIAGWDGSRVFYDKSDPRVEVAITPFKG